MYTAYADSLLPSLSGVARDGYDDQNDEKIDPGDHSDWMQSLYRWTRQKSSSNAGLSSSRGNSSEPERTKYLTRELNRKTGGRNQTARELNRNAGALNLQVEELISPSHRGITSGCGGSKFPVRGTKPEHWGMNIHCRRIEFVCGETRSERGGTNFPSWGTKSACEGSNFPLRGTKSECGRTNIPSR